MSISKTIAALLGPTLVATALMMLVNLSMMPSIVDELSRSPMLIILAGYVTFTPGLAIVYFHNKWTKGWPVTITLVGWLSVIVGLARMILPFELAEIMAQVGSATTTIIPVFSVVFLFLGGFMSFKAYRRD